MPTLPPELVWGLVPRFIGVIYIIAFAALLPQLPTLIGSTGLGPMPVRLAAYKRDFPGLRRFHSFPTLFWLNSSDTMVRLMPVLGIAAGALCVYGGPLAPFAHFSAWLLWLSLEPAMLIFPWDTMLQEAGFLALFLPNVEPLPQLTSSSLPYPSVAFVFRFFVLRLMLGFGKVKFLGSKRDDSLYLKGFFAWSSVTPLAWMAHHLPAWILRLMLYGMFVSEVVAPMLGFFAGPTRLLSFAMLVGLMVAIQIMGNWGYFNVGYALLCVCLLDTQSSIFDLGQEPWRATLWQGPQLALNLAMLALFVTGLLYMVVFDSWTTRTMIHWPLHRFTTKWLWLRWLRGYLRAIAPFRIVNGYGVFPPNALPPQVLMPLFEGSSDGVNWKAYRYRHAPTSAHERPRFIAPYHPRLDMAAAYSTTCVFDASFYGALAGDGTAYATYTRSSWLERVCQRLMANDPVFVRTFGTNPFPDAPPKQMRVSVMALTPSQLDVRRATGEWWHTRRCGLMVQPHGPADWPELIALPDPEVFHPDWVDYKRAAAPLRAMVAAFEQGMEPERAILTASDLGAEDVTRFWDEFVPRINQKRGDFSSFLAEGPALDREFGMLSLARFERVLERLAWLLRTRTEHQQWGNALPKLPIDSNFRYSMFLHELVMDGREAYLAYLKDPALVVERHGRSTDEAQLWTLAVLRYRLTLVHIEAFRWTAAGKDTYQRKLHGLFEYYPLLAQIVPPGEEYCPEAVKQADGDFIIHGLYPPPGLKSLTEAHSAE
jgi:hypothetical protein